MIAQVLIFFGALELGVSSSIGRFYAKHRSKHDVIVLKETINTSLFLLCVSAIIIPLCVPFILLNFTKIFRVDRPYVMFNGKRLDPNDIHRALVISFLL